MLYFHIAFFQARKSRSLAAVCNSLLRIFFSIALGTWEGAVYARIFSFFAERYSGERMPAVLSTQHLDDLFMQKAAFKEAAFVF